MSEHQIGNFVLHGRIGRGGMATVYLASNEQLKRTVALKILHPEFARDEDFVRLFIEEARKAARLQHPNIITIYSADRAGKYNYIEMEYLRGMDLKKVLGQAGRLSVERAAVVVSAVCGALAYAYEEGDILAHRDVKPQNIMICTRGSAENVPILTDFGISRGARESNAFNTGTVMGTPEYMSPEQAEGRKVDFRTDMYALGVVMFELVTGRPPFRGDTPIATALMHVKNEPPAPSEINSDLPHELDEVIMKCLNKSADDRYDNMAALAAALRPFAGQGAANLPIMKTVSGDSTSDLEAPTMAKLQDLIVIAAEDRGAATRTGKMSAAPKRVDPARPGGPVLGIDQPAVRIGASGRARVEITNRGEGALEGELKTAAAWMRFNPKTFAVRAGESQTIEIRLVKKPAPGAATAFVEIESNGGNRRVNVAADVIASDEGASLPAAASAAVAAALSGGYVLMGAMDAARGETAVLAAGAALVLGMATAVFTRKAWPALAGALIPLAAAFMVFDVSSNPAWAALVMGLNYIPAFAAAGAAGSLLASRPGVGWAVVVLPFALWWGGQFGIGFAAERTLVFMKPMNGFAVRGAAGPAGEDDAMRIVVTVPEANMRTGAGTSHSVAGKVKRGEVYRVTGVSGEWLKVDYNGSEAWISRGVCGSAQAVPPAK